LQLRREIKPDFPVTFTFSPFTRVSTWLLSRHPMRFTNEPLFVLFMQQGNLKLRREIEPGFPVTFTFSPPSLLSTWLWSRHPLRFTLSRHLFHLFSEFWLHALYDWLESCLLTSHLQRNKKLTIEYFIPS
jgi:hypothetical protein